MGLIIWGCNLITRMQNVRWGRTLEDPVDFVVMLPKLLIVNFCPQLFYLEWVALSRYSEYIPQSQTWQIFAKLTSRQGPGSHKLQPLSQNTS